MLSPRQGRWLRRLIEKSKAPIKLWARVDSKFYPGIMEDAIATIEGNSNEEVTVVAHFVILNLALMIMLQVQEQQWKQLEHSTN